jgi:cyclopropane fatty-acyl-phospholipid synthase-like methyltransferase
MRVLDIGVGTGRNAIFLARNGFNVDALDGSVRAINELRAYAEAHALPIHAMVHDLRGGDPDYRAYKLVVCTLVLHHLTPTRANSLLASARMQATPGTLHVLGAITAAGDFFREHSLEDRFYPHPDEILQTYAGAGWEIRQAYGETRKMFQKHPEGSPMRNLVSFLIASKPWP